MASITVTLSPEQADEFLRRLAEDDDYRKLLLSDPTAALAEYGISVSDDVLPLLAWLPSSDKIRRLRNSEPLCPPPTWTVLKKRIRDRVRRRPDPGEPSHDPGNGGPPVVGECMTFAAALMVAALRKPPPDTIPPRT